MAKGERAGEWVGMDGRGSGWPKRPGRVLEEQKQEHLEMWSVVKWLPVEHRQEEEKSGETRVGRTSRGRNCRGVAKEDTALASHNSIRLWMC